MVVCDGDDFLAFLVLIAGIANPVARQDAGVKVLLGHQMP
jgi:hypothetical protein